MSQDLAEDNPCRGLPRPARDRQRHHVLTEEHIRRLWRALAHERPPIAAHLKLQLVTAQRGGEVSTMRWENLELASRWWTIPAERSKNALPHRVPLSGMALAILTDIRRQTDGPGWVFPSVRGDGPFKGLQKAIQRVRKRAGLELRGHDLRRTAASYMASLRISRVAIGKILNHAEPGVTAVYDRHSYDAEKREALDAWAERLGVILAAPGVLPG